MRACGSSPTARCRSIVGSSSVGQGIETVFAQIAADALEMPMDRIKGVFHGSTDHVSEGFGSYSSRSTVMGGSAIVLAAAELRQAIRAAAAERLGCAADDIAIDHGAAVGPGRAAIALGELAGLAVEGSYASNKRTYSYGAACGPCGGRSQDRPCASSSTMWRSRTSGASSIR